MRASERPNPTPNQFPSRTLPLALAPRSETPYPVAVSRMGSGHPSQPPAAYAPGGMDVFGSQPVFVSSRRRLAYATHFMALQGRMRVSSPSSVGWNHCAPQLENSSGQTITPAGLGTSRHNALVPRCPRLLTAFRNLSHLPDRVGDRGSPTAVGVGPIHLPSTATPAPRFQPLPQPRSLPCRW